MKKTFAKGLISQKRLDKLLDPLRTRFPMAVEFKTAGQDVFAGMVTDAKVSGETVILKFSWMQRVRVGCLGKNGSHYSPVSDLIKKNGQLEISFDPAEIHVPNATDASQTVVIRTTLNEEYFFSKSAHEMARVQELNPAPKATETPNEKEKIS